jgi:hypothetical protein
MTTPKKPVRVMIAASVCVIASAGSQASVAKNDDAGPQSEQSQQWKTISAAYASGDLSVAGRSGSLQQFAQFRNIASPFGNN